MNNIKLLLTLVLLITFTGCGVVDDAGGTDAGSSATSATNLQEEDTTQSVTYKVNVEEVEYDNTQSYIPYIGLVKPHNEFTIGARAEGVVSDIYFEIGSTVKQNDVLANLKDGNGNNMSQINQDMAIKNLENAKISLENSKKKVEQNVKASQIAVTSLEKTYADSQGQLDRTKNQNVIVMRNSEASLQNLKNKFARLKNITDLNNVQIDISDSDIIEASEISYENIYSGVELTLFSILPSLVFTMDNVTGLPSGLNRIKNDIEDLQDDLDDIRRDDVDDFLNLIEDEKDLVKDFHEYLDDETVLAGAATEVATIRSSLTSISGQMEAYQSGLVSIGNTYNLMDTSTEIKKKNLIDQIKTIEEQLKLQENAVALSKAQTDLAEYTIQTNLNNMKNQIESAKNNLELSKTLSKTELDGQKHNIEMMELSLKQANLNENYLEVKSNVDGVISDILVEKGQVVYMRDPIAKVFSKKTKEVEMFVEPSDLDKINIGSPVSVSLQKSDEDIYDGEVVKINPTADSMSHLVGVTIILKDNSEKIVPNSVVSVEVHVDSTSSGSILVPLKSVLIRGDKNHVYLYEANSAVKKDIEIGAVRGSKVEILSGIKVGDKVIIEGNRSLKDGDSVEVVEYLL